MSASAGRVKRFVCNEPVISRRGFPALAVDHIFVNAALQPLSLTGASLPRRAIASDHFPLIAELVLSS
jgi:endonuclease/exonuclease/phosphatase family metal-dependent hydrolase